MMYTGIIDHLGEILFLEQNGPGMKLQITTNFTDLILGESIAVDGICVTITEKGQNNFICQLSPETLQVTTAKNFQVGYKVNLERSLKLGDRLGGHFVMGHVDTTATIKSMVKQGGYTLITIHDLRPEHMEYIIKKGSVTVNGISLTINEVGADSFTVMIIPHTYNLTHLQFLQPDDKVNIEFDTITRTLLAHLNKTKVLLQP